ncbi:uncharacterized protein LOC126892066 [Diabrotica virgifera virgifera]|uniref:Uncharacterized protein n=1 Tax=Diabrotica virgifera virgifera TaxID=50390 RepID=A0ABM5L4U1_DIAVI|nr:uncharacterized protein LOC126892066 [Diabrotica virgifera virgifera]
MDLNKLNKVSVVKKEDKPITKLQQLEVDKPYKIINSKIVNTAFGQSVLLELEESVVFLPKRVTEDYAPYIDQLRTEKYAVVFRGLVSTSSKLNPAASFEIIEI